MQYHKGFWTTEPKDKTTHAAHIASTTGIVIHYRQRTIMFETAHRPVLWVGYNVGQKHWVSGFNLNIKNSLYSTMTHLLNFVLCIYLETPSYLALVLVTS